MGAASGRHAFGHGGKARAGKPDPVPYFRRRELVEPAAVRTFRRDAEKNRRSRRAGRQNRRATGEHRRRETFLPPLQHSRRLWQARRARRDGQAAAGQQPRGPGRRSSGGLLRRSGRPACAQRFCGGQDPGAARFCKPQTETDRTGRASAGRSSPAAADPRLHSRSGRCAGHFIDWRALAASGRAGFGGFVAGRAFGRAAAAPGRQGLPSATSRRRLRQNSPMWSPATRGPTASAARA